ncbi:PAMP-induced secreted peptide 2 [Cardamine amara subsp. amara]|uniref:PAMP-induced secreted peptide 2 n=1 Tax=Cardamine amara subsp. amara TaxID=228776 RepID=A0ABD0Z6X5_CARAN
MMMNKAVMGSILFFMLIGSVLVETRLLGLTKTEQKLVAGFFDGGLSLGSIKGSGPSPGEGHKFEERKDTFPI